MNVNAPVFLPYEFLIKKEFERMQMEIERQQYEYYLYQENKYFDKLEEEWYIKNKDMFEDSLKDKFILSFRF